MTTSGQEETAAETPAGRRFGRPWEKPIESPEGLEGLLPEDEDIPLSEEAYLSATTAEYRDLAEEIARGSDATPGPVAAAMAGVGTGLVDFADVTGQKGPTEEELEHIDQAASSDLAMRVISAVVLIGLFGASLFFGGWLFTLFIAFLMVIALGEFFTTLRRTGFVPVALFGLLGMLGTAVAAHLGGPAPMLVVVLLSALSVVLFYSLVPRRRPLDNLALTVFGTAWVSLLGFAIIIGRSPQAIPLILLLVILVAIFDIGSYFTGRAMGRHPMAPTLSPKKTWEGFVGGTVLAVASGAFLSTVDYFPVSLNQSLVLIAIVVLLSPIGDAAESLIKRSLGVKDMGAVMPGHGGLLDRLDGLLFVVPAAYLFLGTAGLL
ncbi:MAG TPA: phosphatidate cytidylyltransferase [Acidimicrobiia bacterium]|nr:phosphatidate cytidylyltransferase [Acidimicrobiia bacterium]